MSKNKAVTKGQKKTRILTEKGKAAQEALQTTWLLKGSLKNAQLSYIRVGKLLAQVREKKMYESLGHVDIEDYAEKRLQLGRSSLYKYLQVYDWISKSHPEWLQPKPKGFIPELADAGDLMWIESELSLKNLSAEKRASLEGLKQEALDGRLRTGKLNAWRNKTSGSKEQSLKSFLSKFRTLRMRCSQVKCVPSEAIMHVDTAIEIIKNAMSLQKAGLDPDETSK